MDDLDQAGPASGATERITLKPQPVATEASAAPQHRWDVLMAQAQRGDDKAYRLLLSEAYEWLRRHFRRRFPPALADDAVQEVLSAVHQKRHTYEPGRPFRRWLAAIARHKRIDSLRVSGRARLDALPADVPVDGHEAPVMSAIVVETLLSQLKPAQAEVIRLTRIEGYSVKETSLATGQSESLVKVNIHRGLGRCAAMLSATAENEVRDRWAPGGETSANAPPIDIGCYHQRAAEGAGHRGLAGEAGDLRGLG